MDTHPLNAANLPPDLGIGPTRRPALATPRAASGLTPDQPQAPRLLDRLRAEIRGRHCSIRTESACVDWARRFILFHSKRHPKDMGAVEVEAFLSLNAMWPRLPKIRPGRRCCFCTARC